jgi:hypothetical protein
LIASSGRSNSSTLQEISLQKIAPPQADGEALIATWVDMPSATSTPDYLPPIHTAEPESRTAATAHTNPHGTPESRTAARHR